MTMEIINPHEIVKVRKEHRCFGCGKKIKKGRKAEYAVFKVDGDIYGNHNCLSCVAFIKRNRKWLDEMLDSDGYQEGDIRGWRIDKVREWQNKRGVEIE